MRASFITLLFISCGLTGCATSGLDAQQSFSCKAPPGISCSSLSGVYANAVANNLPGSPAKSATIIKPATTGRDIVGEAPATGTPVLSEPVVLRVWVAPWEDEHKVLHDQSFLYAVVDPGHWQIAHTSKRILNQFMPAVIAPKATALLHYGLYKVLTTAGWRVDEGG